MKVLAFIPARGGSKGVPKKNIRELAGKPLIAWSIEQSIQSSLIDSVVVSTDCQEIASVAKTFGAEVPFMRPSEISGDSATTEIAMLHCLDYLESQNNLPDLFVLVQCTSPIRNRGVFDLAINYFIENDLDSLLTVCESHRFTWKNPDNPASSYDYMNRPRRQDILDVDREFLETGSFYITKTSMLQKYKNRLCGKIGLFETTEEESYEIDSYTDFIICEEIMKSKLKREA
jgi:N-acylneuraminate cytidylyltransferase